MSYHIVNARIVNGTLIDGLMGQALTFKRS